VIVVANGGKAENRAPHLPQDAFKRVRLTIDPPTMASDSWGVLERLVNVLVL
jgi:hypothetical protein